MNRAILVALGTGAIITSAAAIGIGASRETPQGALSPSEYRAALAAIERSRPERAGACDVLAGVPRETCRAQAVADEIVQVADIEERFRRTQDAARGAQRARIEARYQVARARCAAVKGFERDQCYIATHAARGRALLEIQDPYSARAD
jgi:hypothetical protein